MNQERPEQTIRAMLAQRGVALPDDELEELAAAHSALLDWIAIVEQLAGGEELVPGGMPAQT